MPMTKRAAPLSRRALLAGAGMGLLGASGALTACGGQGGDPSTRLFTWISSASDREQWQAFIDAAQQEDPGFSLTLEGPSFEDFWTKAKTRMTAKDAPALLTTQAARTQEIGPLLAPLEDLAQDAGVDLGAFNEAMMTAMTVDGTIRAVPYDAEPMVLYFNRSLFEDAGLQMPGLDYTTDHFLEDAKALTSGDVHGLAISAGLVHLGMAIGFADGGAPVADGGLTLTDPAIVEGMQFGFDLVTEHGVATAPPAVDSEPAAQQDLMSSAAAMYVDGPWMYQVYADALGDDLGVGVIPSRSGDARGLIQGSGFGIAAEAEDPAAAFRTLAAITTPDVIGSVAHARGTFPSLAQERDRWAEGKPEDSVRAVTALADSGQPLVTTSNWNEIVSVFAQYATDGFRGRRTAQQILGEIQEATAR